MISTLVVAALLVGSGAGAYHRTNRERYNTTPGYALGGCDSLTHHNLNSVCFGWLDGTESSVEILIDDDYAELVDAYYEFEVPTWRGGNDFVTGTFCTRTEVTVPKDEYGVGATDLRVHIPGAFAVGASIDGVTPWQQRVGWIYPSICDPGGTVRNGTAGVVEVTFQ